VHVTTIVLLSPSSPPDPDATHARDSGACLLFHTFFKNLIQNVFADDLAVAGLSVGGGPEVRGMLYMLDPTTPAGDTTFCNDVDSSGQVIAPHTCPEQLQIAMVSAFDSLTVAYGAPSNWLWGRVHTLTTKSQASPLVGAPYQAGPYARPGGIETVDVGSPDLNSSDPRSFAYSAGSQVRHVSVMDPANPIMKMQFPGQEKDIPWGVVVNPNDMLTGYVENQYFTFAHGAQLDSTGGAVSIQTFSAQ